MKPALLPIPNEVRKTVNGWLISMLDGDKIVRDGNTIRIYNESGCELDSISF